MLPGSLQPLLPYSQVHGMEIHWELIIGLTVDNTVVLGIILFPKRKRNSNNSTNSQSLPERKEPEPEQHHQQKEEPDHKGPEF